MRVDQCRNLRDAGSVVLCFERQQHDISGPGIVRKVIPVHCIRDSGQIAAGKIGRFSKDPAVLRTEQLQPGGIVYQRQAQRGNAGILLNLDRQLKDLTGHRFAGADCDRGMCFCKCARCQTLDAQQSCRQAG